MIVGLLVTKTVQVVPPAARSRAVSRASTYEAEWQNVCAALCLATQGTRAKRAGCAIGATLAGRRLTTGVPTRQAHAVIYRLSRRDGRRATRNGQMVDRPLQRTPDVFARVRFAVSIDRMYVCVTPPATGRISKLPDADRRRDTPGRRPSTSTSQAEPGRASVCSADTPHSTSRRAFGCSSALYAHARSAWFHQSRSRWSHRRFLEKMNRLAAIRQAGGRMFDLRRDDPWSLIVRHRTQDPYCAVFAEGIRLPTLSLFAQGFL